MKAQRDPFQLRFPYIDMGHGCFSMGGQRPILWGVSRQVVHRDLKIENFMFAGEGPLDTVMKGTQKEGLRRGVEANSVGPIEANMIKASKLVRPAS